MAEKITVDGEEYELKGNPTLGTVRDIQGMQMDMIINYISEERLEDISLEDEGEIIKAILDENGYSGFRDVMWEKSMLEPIQTISLATDHPFDNSDFDDTPALDFEQIKEKSEDALNGTASDFFKRLGIGMSLTSSEMERRASKISIKQE